MNGIPTVLRALYDGERALEQALFSTAERHPAEHEVHHVATDLAHWSHEHAERIARAAESQGLHLPDPAVPPTARQRTERPTHAVEEPPNPICACWTICAPFTSPPPGTPSTGRCSPRSHKPPVTAACSNSPPRAIRRPCVRCAGPTP